MRRRVELLYKDITSIIFSDLGSRRAQEYFFSIKHLQYLAEHSIYIYLHVCFFLWGGGPGIASTKDTPSTA